MMKTVPSGFDNKLQLNTEKCNQAGLMLRKLEIRESFFARAFIQNELNDELKLSMIFNAVAICHQTRLLANPVLNLYGWEYIEYGFLQLARSDSWLLQPDVVVNATQKEIAEVLGQLFSPDGHAANSTLDRLTERSLLLKGLAAFLQDNYHSSYTEFIASTGNKLGEDEGFYQKLSQTEAFGDPQKKKISFLVKLLYDAQLFIFNDPENFFPVMDYHMQRVLLRLGCVEVVDEELRMALTNQMPQSTDEPVRSACIEALKLIASISVHPIWAMNDFLWPLGRSCCHHNPLCVSGSCEKEPCTLDSMVILPRGHKTCIFQDFCAGSQDAKYRHLYEPIVNTHYY